MAKRKRRRRHRQGSRESDAGRSPDGGTPKPELKRCLRAGLQTIAKILEAISSSFAAASKQNVSERFTAEVSATENVQRVIAEATGGMAILFAMAPVENEPQEKQLEGLERLWNILMHLVEALDLLNPSPQQGGCLQSAYKLLADCARQGDQETGHRAVRMVIEFFERDPLREALVLLYTTEEGDLRPPEDAIDQLVEQVHPLTLFAMSIYNRIGSLHWYIQYEE